ncbi:O-antigen ligase family protein [Saccharophagus degradans]|nr:O-antigen ligase family protein [Saccharophagus degradans]
MAQRLLDRLSAEEYLVFYALAFTYPVYMIGGLYVLGSLIGWLVLAVFLLKVYLLGAKYFGVNPLLKISPIAWIWVLGMLVMLLALLVAHIDRQLGTGLTIKSSIGWAKGWALLALFPVLGSMISIRPAVIARGCCIAAASAIPFAALGIVAYVVGLPGDLFLSPLKAIGGPGEVFQVRLFGMNPETGMARWQFTGPWAPAAGLLSCFYLILCMQEKNVRWRCAGIFGAFVMCMLCQSRAGWAIFFAIVPIMIVLGNLKNPLSWVAMGVVLPVLVLLGEPVYNWVMDSYQQVKESRPGSTRVRGTLARLAVQRWQNEAPIWGHGVVERGPKIVEHMPIGTHHSWYGLLFVKGIVGLLALAIPLALTSIYLLWLAQRSKIALTALGVCVITVSYSFFENLEILAYLYWPASLWLGISLAPGASKKECTHCK